MRGHAWLIRHGSNRALSPFRCPPPKTHFLPTHSSRGPRVPGTGRDKATTPRFNNLVDNNALTRRVMRIHCRDVAKASHLDATDANFPAIIDAFIVAGAGASSSSSRPDSLRATRLRSPISSRQLLVAKASNPPSLFSLVSLTPLSIVSPENFAGSYCLFCLKIHVLAYNFSVV